MGELSVHQRRCFRELCEDRSGFAFTPPLRGCISRKNQVRCLWSACRRGRRRSFLP